MILASLAVSVGAGTFGRIDLHSPPYQPQGGAFSIWGVIYVAILISGLAIMHENVSWYAVAPLAVSLVCSGGWLFAVQFKNKLFSAVLISVSALSAMACVVLLRPDLHRPIDWAISIGPSLLAGWLGVAMGLGINVAYHAQTETDLSQWVLAPGGILVATAGIVGGAPITGVPLIWAAIFSMPSMIRIVVGGLGIVTVIGGGLSYFLQRQS